MISRRRIIAHRGHNSTFPEQTMAAFNAAVDLGADMIETDIRTSRDGVAVLLHDRTVDRTTSGTGEISDLSWFEIEALDAGNWFAPAFRNERIPRLEALFELAERRNIALCIEAKGELAGEAEAHALLAAREIARRGRLDVDAVASFDHAALRAAVQAVPGLRTAPDRLPERGASSAKDLLAQAKAAGATIIQHHFADLTPAVVEEVQEAGVEVWAWPTASIEDVMIAVQSGAIGLMGDDVGNIVSVLRSTG